MHRQSILLNCTSRHGDYQIYFIDKVRFKSPTGFSGLFVTIRIDILPSDKLYRNTGSGRCVWRVHRHRYCTFQSDRSRRSTRLSITRLSSHLRWWLFVSLRRVTPLPRPLDTFNCRPYLAIGMLLCFTTLAIRHSRVCSHCCTSFSGRSFTLFASVVHNPGHVWLVAAVSARRRPTLSRGSQFSRRTWLIRIGQHLCMHKSGGIVTYVLAGLVKSYTNYLSFVQ